MSSFLLNQLLRFFLLVFSSRNTIFSTSSVRCACLSIHSREKLFEVHFWVNSNLLITYQADENLRLIRSSLPEAVEACIDAAGHEFDVLQQRTLLRAASYGQAFCRQVYWLNCRDDILKISILLLLEKKRNSILLFASGVGTYSNSGVVYVDNTLSNASFI